MEHGGHSGDGAAFHRSEAVVQDDEQHDVEEENDKLYGDVNVGQNFHRNLLWSQDAAGSQIDPFMPPPPPPPPRLAPPPLAPVRAWISGGRAEPGQESGAGNEDLRLQRQGSGGAGGGTGPGGHVHAGGGATANTTLYVSEIYWWTTEAEVKAEVCKYGQVKEIQFHAQRASGISQGHFRIDFNDPMAAAACRDGMNGHVFNGRPCVVAFTFPRPPPQAQTRTGRGRNSGRRGRCGGGRGSGGRGGRLGNHGGPMGPVGTANWTPTVPVQGQGLNPMGSGAGMGAGYGGFPEWPPRTVPLPDPMGHGAGMGAGYGGFPEWPPLEAALFPQMMPLPLHNSVEVPSVHDRSAFFGPAMAPEGVGAWPDPSMGLLGGERQPGRGEERDDGFDRGRHGNSIISKSR